MAIAIMYKETDAEVPVAASSETMMVGANPPPKMAASW